jgi:enamine deaminase RidA (YjgF/YER057c/UK114 family)
VRAWRVVEERLAPARPPSTLLGVAALGYPEQLVEIEAVAVLA